jgi:hypothetical protein
MIKDKLIKALRKKYEADMETALATIDIYLANSVGIGEHPQHIQEIDKQLASYCSAKEKLESLIRHFDDKEIPF